jgi:AcrR family transcriptional regulator
MTTVSVHREVGRPRVFSDEAIFTATQLVLQRGGYPELTLEAIAKEVGCTRQALVRRFGSKQALLLAFLDETLLLFAENYKIVHSDSQSPLAALRARFVAPPEARLEISDDRSVQANVLAFVLTASGDPAFGKRFAAINQIYLDEMERLIGAALQQGELRAVDPSVLARTLFSASLGETVRWASTPSNEAHIDRLGEIFDLVITPYRA